MTGVQTCALPISNSILSFKSAGCSRLSAPPALHQVERTYCDSEAAILVGSEVCSKESDWSSERLHCKCQPLLSVDWLRKGEGGDKLKGGRDKETGFYDTICGKQSLQFQFLRLLVNAQLPRKNVLGNLDV